MLASGQSAGRQTDRHRGLDEKAERAKQAGAWATINYHKEDIATCAELTNGEKVGVVYDSVGKDTFEKSLTA